MREPCNQAGMQCGPVHLFHMQSLATGCAYTHVIFTHNWASLLQGLKPLLGDNDPAPMSGSVLYPCASGVACTLGDSTLETACLPAVRRVGRKTEQQRCSEANTVTSLCTQINTVSQQFLLIDFILPSYSFSGDSLALHQLSSWSTCHQNVSSRGGWLLSAFHCSQFFAGGGCTHDLPITMSSQPSSALSDPWIQW